MLWRIRFDADSSLGWLVAGVGDLFADDGAPHTVACDYTTLDTNPAQPAWYSPPPPPPVVDAPPRVEVPTATFMLRFSSAERCAIRAAAAMSPPVDDYLDMLHVVQTVRLDDPVVIAGVDALAAAGLVTPARRDEILGLT